MTHSKVVALLRPGEAPLTGGGVVVKAAAVLKVQAIRGKVLVSEKVAGVVGLAGVEARVVVA